MKMKLYSSKVSPYSRKVKVIAAELGLDDKIEEIITDPFNPPPEFLAANPLGKIPALVTEQGQSLPDSALIVEYLLSRGKKGLKPVPRGPLRWPLLRRAQVADGMIDAAVAIVYEKRRPESIIFTSFIDRQLATIHRSADLLNLEAGELSRDAAGLAEITAGCALGYIDFRLPYIEWRKGREALAEWYAAFVQRPSMAATVPS